MKNLTKSQLIAVLERIHDIANGDDPYEKADMSLMQIQSIAAQVLGKKEIISGEWPIESIINKK